MEPSLAVLADWTDQGQAFSFRLVCAGLLTGLVVIPALLWFMAWQDRRLR